MVVRYELRSCRDVTRVSFLLIFNNYCVANIGEFRKNANKIYRGGETPKKLTARHPKTESEKNTD